MIVVSDASPIIGLAAVKHLDLLRKLYTRVLIPDAVYQEITVAGSEEPGASEVQSLDWIEARQVTQRMLVSALQADLAEGEAEAIALAIELKASLLLVDERRARKVADRLGLKVVGVLGVLVEAKHKGLIPSLRPILDDLVSKAGFRVSHQLYERALQAVGEHIGK
ncbi:MAG: DUF3368 domain-containing protein [Deltaproteobacteria bacterium]|nr:DUF3368 domain-containing protein [Deltaproteobacteria bacterium]